jgi:hypothetical protein
MTQKGREDADFTTIESIREILEACEDILGRVGTALEKIKENKDEYWENRHSLGLTLLNIRAEAGKIGNIIGQTLP